MLNSSTPIEINNKIHERIKVEPMYFNLEFSPNPVVYARHLVLDCLLSALPLLPSDYGFLVWDVYRPRAVQKKLFEWMYGEIRVKQPHFSVDEVFAETCKYMSLPSKVGDKYCPPHLSGGAIDLTIFQLNNGEKLNMGTEFDDCTKVAHSNYFNNQLNLSSQQTLIKKNRDLLRQTMEAVGFTAYQYEWWHYDIGNVFWSKATNQPAIFGPLFGDEEWPVNN